MPGAAARRFPYDLSRRRETSYGDRVLLEKTYRVAAPPICRLITDTMNVIAGGQGLPCIHITLCSADLPDLARPGQSAVKQARFDKAALQIARGVVAKEGLAQT